MGLETATYISDLNSSNPTSSDVKSAGDDHIRLLKSTVKATFPNVSGAVTPTHTELNYVDGVTSAIQTQIDTKGAHAGQAWTGTQNFTGATITAATQTAGDSSTKVATTAFVAGVAFSSSLPGQGSATNAHLRSKGTGTATWQEDSFTTLTVAGTLTSWTPYRFNTSAQTYSLPASPVDGDEVLLANIGTNIDNVLSGNGHNIVGPYLSGASFTLDTPYGIYRVKYDSTSTVWRAF